MAQTTRIAVTPGDGIGPEVVAEAVRWPSAYTEKPAQVRSFVVPRRLHFSLSHSTRM